MGLLMVYLPYMHTYNYRVVMIFSYIFIWFYLNMKVIYKKMIEAIMR